MEIWIGPKGISPLPHPLPHKDSQEFKEAQAGIAKIEKMKIELARSKHPLEIVRAAGISRRNAVVFKPDDRAALAAAKVMKFEFYFQFEAGLRSRFSKRSLAMNEGKSWLVERDCCTTGNCIECIGKTAFGKTIRVVQLDRLSEEKARQVAENWKAYKAVARNTLLGTL